MEETYWLAYRCNPCVKDLFYYEGQSNENLNRLTPNDPYMGRTAPLTSKRCILHIYSTNIGTEYFKRALYSPFLSLQNAECFIMLTCLVSLLFTFYIQNVLKLKKIIPAPKGNMFYLVIYWTKKVHNDFIFLCCVHCGLLATLHTMSIIVVNLQDNRDEFRNFIAPLSSSFDCPS